MPSSLTSALIAELSALSLQDNGCSIDELPWGFPDHAGAISIKYERAGFSAPTVNHFGPPMAKCLEFLARQSIARDVVIHVLFSIAPFKKVVGLAGWRVTNGDMKSRLVLWLTHDPSNIAPPDLRPAATCSMIHAFAATCHTTSGCCSIRWTNVSVYPHGHNEIPVLELYTSIKDIRKYCKPMHTGLLVLAKCATEFGVSVAVRVEYRLLSYMPTLGEEWSIYPCQKNEHVILVYSPRTSSGTKYKCVPTPKPSHTEHTDYVYALADQMRITGKSIMSIANDKAMHPAIINSMTDAGVPRSVAEAVVAAGLKQLLV